MFIICYLNSFYSLEFLRSSKSEEETSSSRGRQCLLRLFSRDSLQDDIPTSLPSATQQLINKQVKIPITIPSAAVNDF